MEQVQVELNLAEQVIRVNGINISLEVLETLTRPDEAKLFQFCRRPDDTVVVWAYHERLALAFNKWMTRYTENPEEFSREWQIVSEFLRQQANGEEPSYGAAAAAYLVKLMTVEAGR